MSPTPDIRPAQPDDATPLSDLAVATYTAAFGHSYTPDDLAAHIKTHLTPAHVADWVQNDRVLVAEADAHLVGFVQYRRAEDGDGVLNRLYVNTAHQNRGLGTRLIKTALADPTLRDAPRVVLEVWEHNPGAQRFYARHGFRVIGRVPFTVASGVETSEELVMERSSGSQKSQS